MAIKELEIPPDALTDPDAFEMIRIWAAHEKLQVTIKGNLLGGTAGFGSLIADLVDHGSLLYSQREKMTLERAKHEILSGFRERLDDDDKNMNGEIPVEH